jgi:hypothetical protein
MRIKSSEQWHNTTQNMMMNENSNLAAANAA